MRSLAFSDEELTLVRMATHTGRGKSNLRVTKGSVKKTSSIVDEFVMNAADLCSFDLVEDSERSVLLLLWVTTDDWICCLVRI